VSSRRRCDPAANGLIAYDGAWLGGETFVSSDKKAVSVVAISFFSTSVSMSATHTS
jgi:hypothetical protein